MATETDVAAIVGVISAAYPNFSPTEHTVEVYYQALRDMPIDLLRAATWQSVGEPGRKFAPSVGEIRGTAREIQRMIEGIPSSYEAWEVARKVISGNHNLGMDTIHPYIARTIRLLGLQNLKMSMNQTADRMRFVEAYDQLVEKADDYATLLPEVRGYIEAHGGKVISPLDQIDGVAGLLGVTSSLPMYDQSDEEAE